MGGGKLGQLGETAILGGWRGMTKLGRGGVCWETAGRRNEEEEMMSEVRREKRVSTLGRFHPGGSGCMCAKDG